MAESSSSGSQAPSAVLQGTVETLTFHNPESAFVVLKLAPDSGYSDPEAHVPGLFTTAAVGRWEHPAVGARVRLRGRWTRHATHGRRFEFEIVELITPESAAGLMRYLASGAFPGVGEITAQRIVAKLGLGALDAIRKDPDALNGVAGLKRKVREELVAEVKERFSEHERVAFLRGVGLSASQARAVFAAFGDRTEVVVRRDPYSLSEVVSGVGFATADRIAQSLGLALDSRERCRAGLLHVLREASANGDSFLPRGLLLEEAVTLLESAPATTIESELEELARARRVVIDAAFGADPAVYLAALWASEAELAEAIARLACAREVNPLADRERLLTVESEIGLELDDEQRSAVLGLLSRPVALLTGGPGVGKTTIVRLVVALAERSAARIALASPTGRAARRLAEATGREAKTLHRLLGFDPKSGTFAAGREHPLDADLVVVDEISMLDVLLAPKLFNALRPEARIVLVGDPDQLPSVGPGHVLHDLIASGGLPVFRLKRIYRQKLGGRIVENAHRILHGEVPELPPKGDLHSDFYFFAVEGALETAERLVEVVTERIGRNFGLEWSDSVQVLAPMYRGACGVDALNERLRAKLAPRGPTGLFGQTLAGGGLRAGDRVIQTRNDYEKEVFNGDLGRVARVGQDGAITVAFPERELIYVGEQRSDLQLAFAITVHRAQGSEYEAVVMPLVMQHALMLKRNLLYTAVTRAKRLMVLVGSRSALELAVRTADDAGRRSNLAQRLRRALSQ